MQSYQSSERLSIQLQISLIKYDKILLNEGLINAYNPIYTIIQVNCNQENAILQSQVLPDIMDLDLIQMTYQKNAYLLKCNNKGQILFSGKQIDQKYQFIFNDKFEVAIDKLAFISGQSFLFFLDKEKNVSTLQFLGQSQQKYSKQIHSKVDFLIGSKDQSSVLLVDEFRRFIIYDQSVFKNVNQLSPLQLEIDSSQKQLLQEDNERILSSIQSIDYIQHEAGYFIYLASQQYLYKLNYHRDNEGIQVNQIIRIDQSRGKVQKIVALNSNQGKYFEVVVVQQKSVDQYLFTQKFSTKNLWKSNDDSDKIAFDYTYKTKNSTYYHIIQCVSQQELYKNKQNQLEFNKSYVFVTKD